MVALATLFGCADAIAPAKAHSDAFMRLHCDGRFEWFREPTTPTDTMQVSAELLYDAVYLCSSETPVPERRMFVDAWTRCLTDANYLCP